MCSREGKKKGLARLKYLRLYASLKPSITFLTLISYQYDYKGLNLYRIFCKIIYFCRLFKSITRRCVRYYTYALPHEYSLYVLSYTRIVDGDLFCKIVFGETRTRRFYPPSLSHTIPHFSYIRITGKIRHRREEKRWVSFHTVFYAWNYRIRFSV